MFSKPNFKSVILIVFIMTQGYWLTAQTLKGSKYITGEKPFPLKVGEKIPDIVLGELIMPNSLDSINQIVRISDFKGKILILDYWSSTCSSCISAFPKIEKLQQEFTNSIFILPVGFNNVSKGSINRLIQKWKGTFWEMKLPTISRDYEKEGTLENLFPFRSVPTIIWIDRDGIYRGKTDDKALTDKNIKAFIDGKYPLFKEKPIQTFLSEKKPFLVKNNYGSLVSNYVDTLISTFEIQQNNTNPLILHYYSVNNTIFEMYRSVYYKMNKSYDWLLTFQGMKRVYWEGEKNRNFKDRYMIAKADNWQTDSFNIEQLFNYDIKLPYNNTNKKKMYWIIKEDIDKFFQVNSSIEKKKIKCLAFVTTKVPDPLERNETINENASMSVDDTGIIHFRSYSTKDFVEWLNGKLLYETTLPIIDLSKYSKLINVSIRYSAKHLEELRKELNRYNFDLRETEIVVDVLSLKKAP